MALDYHEPPEELAAETREIHRGLASLIEELEAVDWYQHRIDVSKDDDMRSILMHNRDEELEHAAMALEWLRRQLPVLDFQLRAYLFADGAIVKTDEQKESAAKERMKSKAPKGSGSLGIGNYHRPDRNL